MALIRCPECGKENVSDSAESCPSCGYGIQSYFENKQIQEQKEIELQKKQQVLEQEKQRKERKLEEIAAETEIPKNKPFINGFLLMGFLFLIGDIFIILIGLRVIEGDPESVSFWGISFFSFIAILFLAIGYSVLSDSRKLYDEHSHNQEEYKKVLAAKTLREIEIQDAKQEAKQKEKQKAIQNANKVSTDTEGNIKCPKCDSTQIQMLNRRWSAGTGLLTNKIDRVCMNCKHKF